MFNLCLLGDVHLCVLTSQGSYGHYKPGKVMEIQNANSRPWKGYGKQYFSQSFGKVMEIASNIIYILSNRRNSNTIMIIIYCIV